MTAAVVRVAFAVHQAGLLQMSHVAACHGNVHMQPFGELADGQPLAVAELGQGSEPTRLRAGDRAVQLAPEPAQDGELADEVRPGWVVGRIIGLLVAAGNHTKKWLQRATTLVPR